MANYCSHLKAGGPSYICRRQHTGRPCCLFPVDNQNNFLKRRHGRAQGAVGFKDVDFTYINNRRTKQIEVITLSLNVLFELTPSQSIVLASESSQREEGRECGPSSRRIKSPIPNPRLDTLKGQSLKCGTLTRFISTTLITPSNNLTSRRPTQLGEKAI